MGAVSNERSGLWLQWTARVLLAAGVAILLSYLPYRFIGGEGVSKLTEMRAELARVNSDIVRGDSDVRERKLRVEALKNDTRTIEDLARQELQMLYPHEKALRLKRMEHPKP
jgi:cell division protein FtsB